MKTLKIDINNMNYKEKFCELDLTYFLDLENFINNNIQSIVKNSKFLITFSELYSAFAISKAEDSELIIAEAQEIQKESNLSQYALKIKLAVDSLDSTIIDTTGNEYQTQLKKLYNKLEFANILSTFRYVNTDMFLLKIKNEWFTPEIIIDLHTKLTGWLDDLFKWKGLSGYWKYASWIPRKEDIVQVWGYLPEKAENIKLNLEQVNNLTKSINSLDDVFQIHWLLYWTHPFNNWNKRLSRIIESVLLRIIWFKNILTPNIGYHYEKWLYKRSLLNDVIKSQNFNRLPDMWKSAILLSAIYIIERELSLIKKQAFSNLWLEIFSVLPFWKKLTTKELMELYNKYNKKWKTIPERTFYYYLEQEKSKIWDLILEEKVWRNVIYSFNIWDNRFEILHTKLISLIDEYKKYNMTYYDIPFLKLY